MKQLKKLGTVGEIMSNSIIFFINKFIKCIVRVGQVGIGTRSPPISSPTRIDDKNYNHKKIFQISARYNTACLLNKDRRFIYYLNFFFFVNFI